MIADVPRLHAVTDDRVIAQGGTVQRAGAMAEAAGGSLAVHLRSRALEGRALLELGREILQVIAPHGAWLVVNGRADVARALKAKAVVSGQDGLAAADIRRVAPGVLVMRSVHDAAGVRAASGEGADALIASTGEGYRESGIANRESGIANRESGVVRFASETNRPVIAIGGITPETTPDWLAHGAFGVAAIRALWDAASPADAARAFLGALPRDDRLNLVINGAPRTAHPGTLADLLQQLQLDARAVVVEHNRRIVRRDALAVTLLANGDTIELVHFVGGG